ncbi:MAG: hypothetical protein WAM82_36125 [Thermoanaerobaculia bacterium]
MSPSDSHVAAGTSRYPRSAHATIRGYLYQTCLGVLRWLDLQPNEILLCEGDEDLDRFLLGGGSVSEQVKARSGKLSTLDRNYGDVSPTTKGGSSEARRVVLPEPRATPWVAGASVFMRPEGPR